MAEHDEQEIRRIIAEWVVELTGRLDATQASVDVDEILSIAGISAHAVLRPAAPVTTYLLGYVAGRAARDSHGDVDSTAVDDAAAIIRAAAAERDSNHRDSIERG
jgi:Domain of unknown function (DUF6457)